MEPRISILTLGVRNLAAALQFYRDGLGLPTTSSEVDPIVFFKLNGTKLALYPLDSLAEDVGPGTPLPQPGFTGITLAHNVRTKTEVAALLNRAAKAGGKIVKPAQDVFWGGHSGYFSDPDGYLWEVAWAPTFEFNEDGSLKL